MKDHAAFVRAISAIYEASIAPEKWNESLVAIAAAMDASQSAMMVLENGQLVAGTMPLMDPADLRKYAQIRAASPVAEGSASPTDFALGKVVGIDDDKSREEFVRSNEYREWWTEHDLGVGALFANVSLGGSRLAQIGLYRSQSSGFTAQDRLDFAEICDHLVRASRIQRRIGLGETKEQVSHDHGHAGFLVVDRDYRILGDDEHIADELLDFGVVCARRSGEYVVSKNGNLRKLIDNAQPPKRIGGSCWLDSENGRTAWVDVMPVETGDGRPTDWLNLEQPAALLQFTIPQKRVSLRLKGLATEFGLTPAENAVAIEIVKGDGRAAAARRLGITESTVRSHLSVIFEKLGIHRQSELVRLLAG